MDAATIDHTLRIKKEMRQAGVTPYGSIKMASRYLPEVIHFDESIKGIVYGQSSAGSVMFVATDKRLLIIDKKPFFTNIDELNYEVLSGVRINSGGIFVGVTVHTKIGDFSLNFVNRKCANKFVSYIERTRIEQ